MKSQPVATSTSADLSAPKSVMTTSHIGIALVIAALWGASGPVSAKGISTLPPFLFAAIRFFFAAVPAVFFFPRPKTSWLNLLGVGLGFFVQFAAMFWGLHQGMGSGLSSVILQVQVVFTALLALVFFKERLHPRQWLGIGVALLGIILVVLKHIGGKHIAACTWMIVAALGWSTANMFMKRSKDANMMSLMVWSCLIPPLPLLGLSFWHERALWTQALHAVNGTNLFCIAYLSVGSTLVGYSLWGRLLTKYPAGVVAPFSMLVPVISVFSGVLFLQEPLPLWMIWTALLILFGIALVVVRKRK